METFSDLIDRFAIDQIRCPALKDLGLQEVGITHAKAGWCFIRQTPEFALIIATISGGGSVICDKRWQEAGRETVYTMPAGVEHGYRVCQYPGEWKYAWAKVEKAEKYPELFRQGSPVLAPAPSYSLEAAIRGLDEEAARGNHPQLVGIWCDLIRASLTHLAHRPAIDPRIEKLWELVARRLEEEWDVEALAAEAHLGREHLRRLCQRHYGCSPRRRLTWLRLRKSCQLLLLTESTLEVIAERVGFSDAFSFSKAFAREYGMPPSKYREKLRGTATGLV